MKKSKIAEWLRRQWPGWKKKGAEEGRKAGQEFMDQARKMLVGAIIALILVVLGFPRLVAWYKAYEERQMNPAREVFIDILVLEARTLVPLEGVYVQVAGDETAIGYTDTDGRLTLPYEAEKGENTVTLILSKDNYREETEPEIALPEKDGDTTLRRTFQLFPKAVPRSVKEQEQTRLN